MYVETLPWQVNYDEAEVPPYQLTDPLLCSDGSRVTTFAEWEKKRRPELLQFFKDYMYGDVPPLPDRMTGELYSEKKGDLGGLADRKEIRLHFAMENGKSHFADLLIYTPANAGKKVPFFVGLAFKGNQVAVCDPEIRLTGLAFFDEAADPAAAAEESRGSSTERYPLREIISRGYGIVICSCNDFFPDYLTGWEKSMYRLFFETEELQNGHRPGNYTCIGAWAWGLSRILDYVQTLPELDAGKVAVYGHSRLGKTALWAGACDERFKLVCVNDSGCGGAALSRRLFGETLYSFFYKHDLGKWWFRPELAALSLHPEKLPFDQHELVALIAPRAVSIHSAVEDLWADPKGEYLAGYYAGEVFKLYGKNPLQSAELPSPDRGVGTDVSYFLRSGGHNILLPDWNHYMDIADLVFGKK